MPCGCKFPCVPKLGFKVEVLKRQEIQETGQTAVGQEEISRGENQEVAPGGQEETISGNGEKEESLQDAKGQEETREVAGGKDESWQVAGGSGRFKCEICGKTRNTRSKMEKHMIDHEEDIEDGSSTCSKCSFQTRNREDLVNHISRAHGIKIQEKCNQCGDKFETQRELSRHIKENHKGHKPCHYFKEDRCDFDTDECRFKHIKLKHGEHICYTCGLIFISRRKC